MLDELKIDPEFEKVLPTIALAEFVLLEDNILADGQITTPIAVWNGVIATGTIASKFCRSIRISVYDQRNEF